MFPPLLPTTKSTPGSVGRSEMADALRGCENRVQVAVRLRPFLPREQGQRQICWIKNSMVHMKVLTVQLAAPPKEEEKVFSFDHCFSSVKSQPGAEGRRDPQNPPPVDQEQVYEAIGLQLLNNAKEGFNGCLFAYGQTGSGKTHTVLGHAQDPGLIPRLTRGLFDRGKQEVEELRVSASFLEIYNETLKDLLNPELKGRKPLYVHQHPQLGVYVPHLTEAPVGTHEECMALLDFGSKIRATSQTNMNSTSSRSHALFTLRIAFPIHDGNQQRIRSSTLNLIDLAGSERVKKSGAAGQRMREGQNINSSLSVLGQVISKLAQGKSQHVPFRQSKLTYLLTDALSGNSKTLMVAAISPAMSEMEETLGTLRFAQSVKKVRTVAVCNEQDVGESDLLLQTMRSEAEELRAAAQQAGPRSPQQARRLQIHADAVEQAVISMQTRIDATMWVQARRAQAEVDRQRREALKGLSLPFAIGGMLGGAAEEGVTASSPYLLNISDDISLAGRLLYFLPEGPPVGVGSEESNRIRLMGLGIPDRLCEISVVAGGKGVEIQYCRRGGRLMVDGHIVSDDQARALYHGTRIVFGRAFAFRVVIPLASEGAEPLAALAEEPPAVPLPAPTCPSGLGGLEQWLRGMLGSAMLSEEERDELLKKAAEVQNDVDEANDLLKEIENPPQQVLEVGVLLRPPQSSSSSSSPPHHHPPDATLSPGALLHEGITPGASRMARLVVHCSRATDGELVAVWPVSRFHQHLEELRDHYQQRCDRQREGLPVAGHEGIAVAWEDPAMERSPMRTDAGEAEASSDDSVGDRGSLDDPGSPDGDIDAP